VIAVVAAAATLAALPAVASAFTAADVNGAVDKGLAFLDTQQMPDGSWDSGGGITGAETALALASYGVKGYANLSPAEQTIVQNGMKFLLSTQAPDGSFDLDAGGFFKTYDTGTALIALSLLGDVPTTPAGAIATAITNARNFLVTHQTVTGNGSVSPCTPGGTSSQGGGYCGGWDYDPASENRSDESNTGFGVTGLAVTGGVPAGVAAANVGWQRNIQQLCSGSPCLNPSGFTARNDGGGAYEPGISSGDFSSNANDNGSLLFGYGFDGVPATDPGVQAAIKIAQDTLDTYETAGAKADRTMVFHEGMNEDGSCDPTVSGCDWGFGSGEGGYHYSLFALEKGLSQYLPADLSDPNNFFFKIVDLLITQQGTDGSWPSDPRDDGSQIGATGFAILALGRVGAPPDQPITNPTGAPVSATEGQPFSGTVATFTDPDTASTASEYSATVDWGDGTTSTGTISGTSGNFTVSADHTYAEEGAYTVKVTITDVDNTPNTATTSNTATVADAALTAAGTAVTAVEGASASHTVATFTDANPGGTVSDFTATINWGDGSTSSGTVSGSGGNFTVTGTHAYAEEGTYTVTVSIKDVGGSTASATDTAKVSDAPLTAVASAIHPVEGASASLTVATFTDADPGGKLSDYSATINWGDGSTTTGTITPRGKGFAVSRTHTYAEEGNYAVTVTIKDVGGSTATAHQTARVSDAPLHAFGVRKTLRGRFSGVIARFTDADPGGKLSDYTAKINWGDRSTTTAGSIGDGPFTVHGSHHYGKPGVYHVTVRIRDEGGSVAIARSRLVIVTPGTASLTTPPACVLNGFVATVRGREISGVTFTLDGSKKTTSTGHRGTLYSASITVSPGAHHLTVQVTFLRASRTRTRTFERTVTGCPTVVPKFTG
jgi:PKD repeat protein